MLFCGTKRTTVCFLPPLLMDPIFMCTTAGMIRRFPSTLAVLPASWWQCYTPNACALCVVLGTKELRGATKATNLLRRMTSRLTGMSASNLSMPWTFARSCCGVSTPTVSRSRRRSSRLVSPIRHNKETRAGASSTLFLFDALSRAAGRCSL